MRRPTREIAVLLALSLLRPALAQHVLSVRVLQGQEAINNVLTGTAMAPLVEVRDEAGQPVAGAEVTFELPGDGPGGSFHGWMRAQTLRTDALGQVAAAGFAPNGETGRFEMRVIARSGARTGEATIAQTNGPAPAERAVPRRRKFGGRKLPAIVIGASTGLAIALNIIVLKRNPGSKFGWWSAAVTVGSLLGFVSLLGKRSPSASDKFPAGAGRIEITPIRHASFMIRGGGAVVHVDPVGDADYDGRPRADLVLITDAYRDHFDPALLPRLLKPGAAVYGPEAAAQTVPGVSVIRNGETKVWRQWKIEAVPAYNLPRDGPGRVFHEKGHGNGYLLTFGGRRVYISGNTGNTPEMCALRDIDIAFLPMNAPYTMSAEEAAAAVRAFQPKVVYPYHYRGSLLSVFRFRNALAGGRTEVRIRNWYQ